MRCDCEKSNHVLKFEQWAEGETVMPVGLIFLCGDYYSGMNCGPNTGTQRSRGLKSRRSSKLQFSESHCKFLTKFRSTNVCKFPTEEIMRARSFNFAFKFSQWKLSAQNLAFSGQKFRTRFSDSQKFKVGSYPPHPVT